ncbi:hypothetical protein PPL_08240 [Heterostelium album PN500]|uniref:F-box domain-containing protein n=1 Tax=Heterostelium pallidum (strain ATCC 26659 / Pp 5 / PN500) TaxID=670386 RepID=D3BJ05_HETP5|nr:hypothetical protein PPL_08240 [Heterostelium album PN500]EFA78779.1 hypothetical protein PPL_08240 [Heterostelium album PN500]|eukprot:XP_020430903.1 hypothetical protein PPL_08240 [Heterostelium album PN500]
MLGNDDDSQSNEYLTFFNILIHVGWLNPQEKVKEEHQHWLKKRVKVKQSALIDLFLSSSSNKKILVGSLFKMNSYFIRDVKVDSIVQRLETSEFGEMMIRQFPLHVGIRNLESLVIFDIYRVRAIEMPSNLFHHILEYIKSNDVDITRLLSRKLYINHSGSSLSKMLLYFYQRVKEPAIFRVLVKSLILMESLDRELIQSVLTPFKLEFLQFSNSYVREFDTQSRSNFNQQNIQKDKSPNSFQHHKSYRDFGIGYYSPETPIFMNLKFLKFRRSVHGTNTHFQRLLDATNKDQLVSVEFIFSNVSTMLVNEEISSLLELRKSSPKVNISASVSTTSIAIDNPDQHSLITSYFFNSEPPKNIILSNLRKIAVSKFRCKNFDCMTHIFQTSPKLRSIKLDPTLNLEFFIGLINLNPNIWKLTIQYNIFVNNVNKIEPISLVTQLNQVFDILNQEKGQQIKIVKLIYNGFNGNDIYIPMLNQSLLSDNLVNIGKFRPMDDKLYKFKRITD